MKHLVARHDAIGGTIVDAFRVQLQRHPAVHPHRAHARGVARSSAEGEAIEYLLHLLIGEELALRRELPGRR